MRMDPKDELPWVRSQLDSLTLCRMNATAWYGSTKDQDNYRALCEREQELLGLPAA